MFAYGIAEIAFGGISSIVVVAGLTPGEIILSRWTALVGAAYVIARGLGNASEGLKLHKKGEYGPISWKAFSVVAHIWWWWGQTRPITFLPFHSDEEHKQFKKWERLHANDDPMNFFRDIDRDKPSNQRRR